MSALFRGRYAREFLAGWGTMDINGHLANTAYLDLAADVRMAFFAEHGFAPTEFRRIGLGPVMRKDEVEYFREIGLHETVTVTYALLASDVTRGWDWQGGRATASVEDELRTLLAFGSSFRILIAHGYSDMVTPYSMSRYVLDHLPPVDYHFWIERVVRRIAAGPPAPAGDAHRHRRLGEHSGSACREPRRREKSRVRESASGAGESGIHLRGDVEAQCHQGRTDDRPVSLRGHALIGPGV